LGKRAKRQLPFRWFREDEDEDDTEHTSSTTEGEGLFSFGFRNLVGEGFGDSDGSDEKSNRHSTEVSSSTKWTSKAESGEAVQATTSHYFQYRNGQSTTSDNFTDEAIAYSFEGADEESTTEQLEFHEDDESDLMPSAARRPGKLQQHVSDDEDYFGEAASGSGMDGRTVPPTSAAPPADRQPSEYCASFCKVGYTAWHSGPDQDLLYESFRKVASNFVSYPPVMQSRK
jgi:hypothetical protein